MSQGLTSVRVVPSTFAETMDKTIFNTPELYVEATAREKALDVWNMVKVLLSYFQ